MQPSGECEDELGPMTRRPPCPQRGQHCLAECDGLAGTRLHTPPTCADAAGGAPEHHGTTTNGEGEARTTREGGAIRRLASGPEGKKEWGEKAIQGEEERHGGARDREDTEERTPGWGTWETREWFALDQRIEDDRETKGDWNIVAIWEAERNSLPCFRRSVADPGV
ncbi:hypothetical protein NDU88_000354 [Pleurodeles waltl]|uniref:Uncharacterized protein n=1 Tax=Pleurodeles waltl TaxID=8319 RepID=A0AAV7S7X9_PLEWA|nr:hypothetical protein NDU88_000354 [Pleurodeles waltl]